MPMALLYCGFLFLLTLAGNVNAEDQLYVGVWQRETGSNILTGPREFSAFRDIGNELAQKGLRLVDFEVFHSPDGLRYVGVWRSGTGSNLIVEPLRALSFREKREELMGQGLRLTDIQVILVKNQPRFIGVWRNGTGEEIVSHPMTRDAFLSRGAQLTQEGLRLIDFHTVPINGIRHYVGVWRTGSGTNLINEPLPFSDFERRRDEMNAQGLRLLSLDVFLKNGKEVYEGVWGPGGGENKVTEPRTFIEFMELGNKLTKEGWRLINIALVHEEVEQTPKAGGGAGTMPTVPIPSNPAHIKLSNDRHLIIDFSLSALFDGNPEITIPIHNLPILPKSDDTIIIPSNFCGMRVIAADRFLWLQGDQVKQDPPFNNVIPESNSIQKEFGDAPFFKGIDFTGPIGPCKNGTGGWAFPFPLTQTGSPPPSGLEGMKLIFELSSDSKIEFLNFKIKPGKILSADELFDDKVLKLLKDIVKNFKEFGQEKQYCDIEPWVKFVCEESDQSNSIFDCKFVGKSNSNC